MRIEATQARLLNAIPAHVALLGGDGVIVSVNDSWRACPSPQGRGHGPGLAVGTDFLELCRNSPRADQDAGQRVSEALRAVLDGKLDRFTTECQCPLSEQPRWFELSLMPVAGVSPGALLMYIDITARRLTEEALRASEHEQRQLAHALEVERSRLVAAERVAMVGSWETDLETFAVVWSAEAHRLHETDPASFHPTHEGFLKIVHPDDRAAVDAAFFSSMQRREPCRIEHRLLMPDGRIKLVEERWQVFFNEDGKPVRAVGTCQDITERKLAESALRESEARVSRLNRVYIVLSQINALIVRVASKEELFREACRIAVEGGGLRMAMIAMIDKSTGHLAPVASSGKDEELLDSIRTLLASEQAATTMVARAIRQKSAIVSNDASNDPQVVFADRYIQSDVRSIAVLPLLQNGEAIGIVALYADVPDFFHDEEMQLLTGLASDIAFAIDHIEKSEKLDYLSYYDALTGLANRTLFLERVAQFMRSAAGERQQLALLLFDLERFKNINDSLGRQAGDSLLRQVAEWLTLCVGDANLLARVGADQFALVLPAASQVGDVAHFLENTMEAIRSHPFRLDDADFRVSARFGVALFPEDGGDADTLFKHAEAALKKAKSGGEHFLFYTEKMTAKVADKLILENKLRQALENEEFVLHYQPKRSLQSGQVTGAEALIRWNDPRTGLVPPGRFIPVLEETGLINEVGRWALRDAIKRYLRWRDAGLPAERVAVNVSPLQLRNRGFVAQLERELSVDARASEGLELEITESIIMEDVNHSVAMLQAIRDMGVKIAIDDFGTGFSSLSYLSRLPVDTLKIDRSFVVDMMAGPDGLSLISAMINLAHGLDLKVVAEGVETEEQARLLHLLRCNEIQGFLFSRPLPAEDFEARFFA